MHLQDRRIDFSVCISVLSCPVRHTLCTVPADERPERGLVSCNTILHLENKIEHISELRSSVSSLLGFGMRAKRMLAWLPVAEQKLNDADKDDAIECSNLLDQHCRRLASGNDAERQSEAEIVQSKSKSALNDMF